MAVFILTYENSEWKNAWTHRRPVCLYLPIWLYRCHQHSQHPQVVPNHNITTADGQVLKAVGMGDAQIKLPNGGDKQSKVVLKDAIYAHNIAFMLILVSCLDIEKYSVTFSGGICTIKSMTGCTIMMILCTNGLYHIMAVKGSTSINYANVASIKMTISEAHQKLGHIMHDVTKHTIYQGHITGIQQDPDSKPEFCKLCAKAKLAWQPFLKRSQTHATEYGECIHWDIWRPAAVKSLSSNLYIAAWIEDAMHETKLYFQMSKSQTIQSYKQDKALIKMKFGNCIKIMCSDCGREFLSNELKHHQDMGGHQERTHRSQLTPQNGITEYGMHMWALLIPSGLLWSLREEAMKHATWIQDCTPACMNDGKTLYKMKNKEKLHLADLPQQIMWST